MSIFDRFRRQRDVARSPAAEPVMPADRVASDDERALERYRYLLRTAPPETIEQAHAEAFAQLTPDQRRKLLAQMGAELPVFERAAAEREGASAPSLARAVTRAEMRQPGTIERMFGGGAAGSSFGGLMLGTMLSSMAGMVLGSMIAQHFLHDHAADAPFGQDGDAGTGQAADAGGDTWAGGEGDFGGFDGGSFDV